MILTLKLVEGTEIYDHRNRNILLFKEVNWSCVPIPKNGDVRVSLGRTDDGEETGWSIVPNSVWFDVSGEIVIELQAGLSPVVDVFDNYIRYAKNDGFVEYDEWIKTH